MRTWRPREAEELPRDLSWKTTTCQSRHAGQASSSPSSDLPLSKTGVTCLLQMSVGRTKPSDLCECIYLAHSRPGNTREAVAGFQSGRRGGTVRKKWLQGKEVRMPEGVEEEERVCRGAGSWGRGVEMRPGSCTEHQWMENLVSTDLPLNSKLSPLSNRLCIILFLPSVNMVGITYFLFGSKEGKSRKKGQAG